jgi:uncharacterized small protein (DUF1192 family)
MSKVMTMNPSNVDELQDFAYTLGENTQKFSTHPQYKQFVKDLLSDLMEDMSNPDVAAVRNHIERLAAQRAKEEKSGNVTHFLQKRVSDDEVGDGMNGVDAYLDFM